MPSSLINHVGNRTTSRLFTERVEAHLDNWKQPGERHNHEIYSLGCILSHSAIFMNRHQDHFIRGTPVVPIRHADLKVDSGAEVLAGEDGVGAKLLLNAEDLVELGKTLRSCRRTSLDLASADANNDIGDGHILGLTGAVGHHDAPVVSERVLGSLDGLGKSADLVDL